MKKLMTVLGAVAMLLSLGSCKSASSTSPIPDGKMYLYSLSAEGPEASYDEAAAVACIQGLKR